MKHIKHWLATIAVLLCSITVSAYNFKVDGIYYRITSSSELTVGVADAGRGKDTFSSAGYTNLVIPETVIYNNITYRVTSIEENAFAHCSGLTYLFIPANITKFNSRSGGSSSLTSIVVDEDNVAYDSRGGCNAVVETNSNTLVLGSQTTIIPESVTSIGDYAFEDCNLTSITIPEGVTDIGKGAFENCSLTSITIPEGVTSIGEYAFYGCNNLTSINIPESVTEIGDYAFIGCSSLTSIVLPKSLKSIESKAFADCENLTDVYCNAKSVPSTSRDAFDGSYPEYVTLHVPANALNAYKTTEPWSSFGTIVPFTEEMPSATLPIVLTEADGLLATTSTNNAGTLQYEFTSDLFTLDEATNTLYFTFLGGKSNNGATPMDHSGYPYVALSEFYLYDGEGNEIALSASNFSTNAQEPTEGPITNICDDDRTSFWHSTWSSGVGDYHYLKITLPAGQELTEFKFGYITRYTSQCLPSVIHVGTTNDNISFSLSGTHGENINWSFIDGNLIVEGTGTLDGNFTGLGGIKSVEIKEGITAIGENAFLNCNGFTAITLPEGVTSIGSHAFHNCRSLTSITLPEGVTSIGDYAFYECSSLTNITIPESVTSIGAAAFEGCSRLTVINIPEGVTSIGNQTFSHCSSLTAITIPEGVTYIGGGAFRYCSRLTAINIPEGVTSIGNSAFEGCSSLTSITCHAVTPPTVGNSFTFYGVDKSIPVYVPEGSVENYKAAEYWKNFTNITALTPTEVSITINQYGSGTYCSEYALDFSNVEGLKAYAATGYNSRTGVVTLTRVMTTQPGEGLFIKGNQGKYVVPIMESTDDHTINMLKGTLTETSMNATSGLYANYKYTIKEGNSQPLFYQFTDGSTLGAGKAYLQIPMAWLPQTSEAKSISLRFDEGEGTTDMENSQFTIDNSQLTYDLYGRRVAQPVKGGIYIVGGRKVVVK